MVSKSPKTVLCFVLLISFLFLTQIVSAADDSYKPYLHKANVPEHPKIKLYGSYSTSLFPGDATYTYPIEVPRGTNGLQPSLSITYSSQSVKQRPGILGAGWSVTQSYIYRDINSTPSDTTDDGFKLVFNGASHDLVYDSNENLYRTKIETFFRIQSLTGGNNTYGNYWVVTARDGTQFRFGYNPDSELTSNTGRNYAVKWSLDQVNDTHDNKIFYSHSEDPNPGDVGTSYLSQIIYNNDRQRKIEFVYENSTRPDLRLVYEQGNQLNETRRLKSVNISANNISVRSYVFEYQNLNPEKSLSSISKIKFFGSDGVSMLHQVSFEYYTAESGYTNTQNAKYWLSPTIFAEHTTPATEHGVRLVDFDNDGFLDIVKAKQSANQNGTWINNRNNNWTAANSSWNLPVYILDADNVDNGVRFIDFNTDGFVDLIQNAEKGGEIKSAYRNNGSSWVPAPSSWIPPTTVYFMVGSVDNGVREADLNCDGRTDLIKSNNNGGPNNGTAAYLNNGNNWVDASSTWLPPAYFVSGNEDNGTRIEDVNGDCLPDIIESSDKVYVTKRTWLNSGAGWVNATSTWLPPVSFITPTRPDNGIRFADLNGDGLVDIVQGWEDDVTSEKHAWINNGSGWVQNDSWKLSDIFVKNGRNIGIRLADVTGDGAADVIYAYHQAGDNVWSWTSNLNRSFLLKKITNELGGVTTVNYEKSTSMNNNGTDTLSDIGFNVWVVKNVSQDNSVSGAFNAFGIYSYVYAGGKYEYNATEFRGFNQVNETLPDNTKVAHYFNQSEMLKGKEYRTDVYNSSGKIFSRTDNVFNYTKPGSYFKVFLTSQASYLYDGEENSPNVTNVSYSYGDFGNVIEKVQHGFVNITGDEKYERYSYVFNTSAWTVDRLSRYQLFAADGITKVSETKYSYDGKPYGSNVSLGDLSEVETWINPYTGGRHIVKLAYDKFGNVIRETDPRGFEIQYRYGLRDTTFTYPDKITNALFHTADYQYDLGTGNLQWQKQNEITTYFYYDKFGRIIKEVQPFDSFELPTKNYSYNFDGTAPEQVKVSSRTTANKTYDVYYFYDGFANFIQLKRPADGNQQIVKNFFYDGLGRIVSEQNPYFDGFSTGLSTLPATINSTNYTFDALSRVNKILNPDSTTKTINFNHQTITAYDESNHRKAYVTDAHVRITNVFEYNNDPVLGWNFESDTYNTSYEYDTADNLVKITDTLGNVFTFTYDSLGRRIALSDPDLGNWTYTYDLAGNLIRQKQQGGGNLITGDGYYREYDALNQLIRIRNGSTITAPIIENYTYDPFGQRIKISRNDTANTTIYTPFKELMRIKNSTGSYDFTYVYQDGTLVARVNPDGSKYFYHPDHLGSTSLITDANGNVVESTFYSPYGELLGGGTADVKLYTGQMKDIINQYYYGARYYKPVPPQFIQPDLIIQNAYNSQNLNRYSYAWNNPYKFKDISGRCIEPFSGTVCTVAIVTVGSAIVAYPIIAQIQLPPPKIDFSGFTGIINDFGSRIQSLPLGGFGFKLPEIGDLQQSIEKLEQTIQNAGNKITQAEQKSTTGGKSSTQSSSSRGDVPQQTPTINRPLTESPSALGRTQIELDKSWKLQIRIDFGKGNQPVEIQLDLLKPQDLVKKIDLHQLAQDIFGNLRHIKIPGLK